MLTTQHDRPSDLRSDSAHESGSARPPEPAVEAPDRGDWNAESPEDAVSRHAEAPDAGDSRAGLLESEFTRGRSTS